MSNEQQQQQEEDDGKLDKVYADLLIDCGIFLPEEDVKPDPNLVIGGRKQWRDCCKEREIIFDQQKGSYWCYNCGLVQEDHVYVHNIFWVAGKPIPIPGTNCSTTIVRKRPYQPLTHFKEHLRRYMGARFRDIPTKLCDTVSAALQLEDLQQPDAYFRVKAVLKKNGFNKFYKEIFTIIYHLGGINPRLEHDTYQNCIKDFTRLSFVYMKNRDKFKRHSMPSLYMMLDILLRKNNHIPHYQIPYLKDLQLKTNVESILEKLEDADFIKEFGH